MNGNAVDTQCKLPFPVSEICSVNEIVRIGECHRTGAQREQKNRLTIIRRLTSYALPITRKRLFNRQV